MITYLPEYFAWSSVTASLNIQSTLQAVLINVVCRRFERFAAWAKADLPGIAEPLISRMGSLPDDAFMRILTAPQTGFRLGYDGRDELALTAQFMEASVTAEELRSGIRDETSDPVWTALGECYFAARNAVTAEAVYPFAAFHFAPDQSFQAPRIGDLVVDFASPNARGKLPQIAGSDGEYPPADVRVALARIGAAVDLIARVSEHADGMVRAFTRAIVIRNDPSSPNHYTSASTALCLGRPVLRNPHVPAATECEIADGLVHECIHCVCDLAELRDGDWLVDRLVADTLWVHSPWTGRRLDLHTYLQACWVWYGLWNFWLAALKADVLAPARILPYLARAYRGFSDRSAVGRLSDVRPWINPAVYEALASAQTLIEEEVSRVAVQAEAATAA